MSFSVKHAILFIVSEIVRTVKLKITLPYDAVVRTVNAWTDACNLVSRIAFDNGNLSNAVKLHSLAYRAARSTGLSAQVAVSCVRHVASKYASVRSNKHRITGPCRFRLQAVVLQGGKRGRDVSIRTSGLSVWTVDKRFKAVAFSGPPDLQDKIDNWGFGDGRLFVDSKTHQVSLTLSFKKSVDDQPTPNNAVIGVDRGVNVLACATDGRRCWMRRGGHTKHVRNRYLHVRSSLQKKKAEHPTRSIAKVLKRLSGREARFMRAVNHEVSKSIVEFAQESGCPTIAVEDLDGVRERKLRKAQQAEINQWAYAQLLLFLGYKAVGLGMSMLEIDPRNTSRGCSRCGYTDTGNRRRHVFKCKACGYTNHADLNAAYNIRLRGILARQALSQDGLPSCSPEVRLVDPGLNPGESTGKPPALAGSS